MPFSEIIGQDRAVGALRAALSRGALHHAYLFGGPEGVGKARVARLLAQAANCEGPVAGEACGTCRPCHKIAAGNHPDVLEVWTEAEMARAKRWEPAGGKTPSKFIVVDQVRDVVEHRLALRRFEGRRRFVIFDPADRMNPQAQNALLKTLEEPPPETTLVLVSSSPDSLLPTIRSRCLRVAFAPIPEALVASRLTDPSVLKKPLSPADARFLAALSGGSLGRALALAKDPDHLAEERALVEEAAALDPEDAGTWLAFAGRHGKDREAAGETCDLLGLWLRDVLAAQAGSAELALADVAEATRRVASRVTPAEVLRRRERVARARESLVQNASPVLALEAMLVGWFHGRA
ncbi:MAG: DNA polymerase III subunit delta' [Anaeromyxobacteraceae bacterium]